MRYKCHYCSEFLKPGAIYTLECECGNCNLGFDKSGKVDQFKITFFEKGRDIFLSKSKCGNKIAYGYINTYKKDIDGQTLSIFARFLNNVEKVILQANVELQFDEENVPQVYKLWEKLDKLKAFS